jgi:hypothetical protein
MPDSITPPPELVQQLRLSSGTWLDQITNAYQAGADQELEACVEWLGDAPVVYNDNGDLHPGSYLRDARRPNPPSLKESALNALEHILRHSQTDHSANTIRRALEALPND